jgi:hypothetical protein
MKNIIIEMNFNSANYPTLDPNAFESYVNTYRNELEALFKNVEINSKKVEIEVNNYESKPSTCVFHYSDEADDFQIRELLETADLQTKINTILF